MIRNTEKTARRNRKTIRMKTAAAAAAALLTAGMAAGNAYAQDHTDPYPSMPHMTYEEYPEVDGSLACVPLMQALIEEVTGCSEVQAEESLAGFSNTNPSYERLLSGDAQLILSYEASDEYKERLNLPESLDLMPVGKDALVFLVNEANPVENLTSEQIRGIYTGVLTNWKEVGGDDLPVKAFQRREASGSQTLMRLLLMGDAEIPEKQVIRIEGMEGLIDALLEYDNSANALGYSVYYYASSMYRQDGLKFLAVDGVKPDGDTIRSGEYPLTNPFYVGIGERSGENARMLRDWLLSEEGQQFVEDQGYTAAQIQPAEEADVKIALPSDSLADSLMDVYTLYDRSGQSAGTVIGRGDVGQFWGYLPEETLHKVDQEHERTVLNTTTLETLLHYKEGECVSWVGTDGYCVYRIENNSLEIYDRNGVLLERRTPAGLERAADGDAAGLVMLGTASDAGLLIHIRRRTDQGSEHLYSFLRKADGTCQDSDSPDFPEILKKECDHTIGRYFLYYDSDTNLYDLYTDQGVQIMKGLACSYSLDDYDLNRIQQTDQFSTEVRYVILGDADGGGRVFDAQLNEQGRISGMQMNTWGDYASGLPCEALGGMICTGFYRYCTYDKVPGAVEGGTYCLGIEGKPVTFTLPEGETLVSLNETFVQTMRQGENDGAFSYRVYRMEDLEAGAFEPVMEDLTAEAELCSGSCLITGSMELSGEYTLCGEDLEPLLTTKGILRPALEGNFYLRRGPWHGIIDRSGRWLIRESWSKE